MTIDEKDLEIARLKGKVEALESELGKERAMRAAPPAQPTYVPWPYPVPSLPQPQPAPFISPLPIWPMPPIIICGEGAGTCDPGVVGVNANACNPTTLGEKVWIGETRPSLDALVALSQGKTFS